MILLIDAGNSLTKWQLRDDNRLIHQQGQCVSNMDTINCLVTQWQTFDTNIKKMVLCSVTESVSMTLLKDQLALLSHFKQTQWFSFISEPSASIHAQQNHYTVYNGYADDWQQLGADRWANLLGACQQTMLTPQKDQSAITIVSAGTALTLDRLIYITRSNAWQHQGGFIVPGLTTLRRSLHDYTSALPLVTETYDLDTDLALGRNTRQAIEWGTLQLLLHWLQQESHGVLFLTGGYASTLFAHLPESLQTQSKLAPDLLYDGLQVRFG